MNIRQSYVNAKVLLLSASVLFLTGCELPWSKTEKVSSPAPKDGVKNSASGQKHSSGPKVVEFKDGSVMTMGDIDAEIGVALASSPYMKNFDVSQITPDMKEVFFKDALNRKLVEFWAAENNIENDPNFQDELRQNYKMLVQMKKGEWFSNKIRNSISDSISEKDVKKRYDQEKPRYIKSAGGVRTLGVKFMSQNDAKEFYEGISPEVLASAKDFEAYAKTALNGSFRDFGRISEESRRGAHKALVDEAMSRKSFPSAEIVKVGDDEFWVAMFEGQQDSIFFTFDEVKDQIRGMLEGEKFAERIESEVKALEKSFVKNIDRSVFKVSGNASPASMNDIFDLADAEAE